MARKIKIQDNNLSFKKVLTFWFPVILWTSVIFLFSAKPTPVTSEIIWQDFIVKKTAHIIEYAILATLLYRALINSGVVKKDAGIIAIILAILYGVSDEFHQSFTPGREPKVRDIFFDSFGALTAVYLILNYLSRAPKIVKNWAKSLRII